MSSAAASSSPCGGARERDVGACGVLCDIVGRDDVGWGSLWELWWGLEGGRGRVVGEEVEAAAERAYDGMQLID